MTRSVIKSEFKKWFKQQFGKRPTLKALHTLEEEASRLERAAEKARYLCNQVRSYDNSMTIALYAWSAQEKILKERGKEHGDQ